MLITSYSTIVAEINKEKKAFSAQQELELGLKLAMNDFVFCTFPRMWENPQLCDVNPSSDSAVYTLHTGHIMLSTFFMTDIYLLSIFLTNYRYIFHPGHMAWKA